MGSKYSDYLKALNAGEINAETFAELTINLDKDNEKMATVTQVLEVTEKLAPKGWIVTYEYPDQIGVSHPTFSDDQHISFGDINYDFGFNDVFADGVCGSMEGLTDAEEIAASFWNQIAAIYPDLVKGE